MFDIDKDGARFTSDKLLFDIRELLIEQNKLLKSIIEPVKIQETPKKEGEKSDNKGRRNKN